MARTSDTGRPPKRTGKSTNLYLSHDTREELGAHSDGHGMSASAIVEAALREWMDKHPIDPARRRLIDQRRALEDKLRAGMEEKGIEPRSSDRRTRRDRALRLVAA